MLTMFLTESVAAVDVAGSFTTMANELTGMIGDVLPIALVVSGSLLAINLGYKLFKKFTKG